MPSILDPTTCGFAKAAAFSIFNCRLYKVQERSECNNLLKQQHETFTNIFNSAISFEVEYKVFSRFKAIVKNVQALGKRNKEAKKEVLEFFKSASYNILTEDQKSEHSLFQCNGCINSVLYRSKMGLFMNISNPLKLKAKENGLMYQKLEMQFQLPYI